MDRSIFKELYIKVFKSGNPLFLFLGINVLIFLFINILKLVSFLAGESGIAEWVVLHLSLPADLSELPFKFWTLATYMFTQEGFFHLLFNMLWLYWLGMIFMDFLNKRQFVYTYLAGGFAGGLLYLLLYNTLPVFQDMASSSILLGSSASVMAVIFATATLLPDFTIRMLFLGNVKLKYLALAYLVLNLLGIGTSNAGGNIAHLGGALMGFVYIRQLKNGRDMSNIFKRRSRLKAVKTTGRNPTRTSAPVDQEVIDRILDKISQSGYESLTKAEKEQLFKASSK